jgi:hypothetical protein
MQKVRAFFYVSLGCVPRLVEKGIGVIFRSSGQEPGHSAGNRRTTPCASLALRGDSRKPCLVATS